MACHHFFCFILIFFSHCNSLGKYRGNISVGKIRRQFTNENIPSIFPFVFIDFLIVRGAKFNKDIEWVRHGCFIGSSFILGFITLVLYTFSFSLQCHLQLSNLCCLSCLSGYDANELSFGKLSESTISMVSVFDSLVGIIFAMCLIS